MPVSLGSAVFSIPGWEPLYAEGDVSYTRIFDFGLAPLARMSFKGQLYVQLHTKSSITCSQYEKNR